MPSALVSNLENILVDSIYSIFQDSLKILLSFKSVTYSATHLLTDHVTSSWHSGGERTRWIARLRKLEEEGRNLTDHCLLAASFLAYFGPFDYDQRQRLIHEIAPFTDIDFAQFLLHQNDYEFQIRQWTLCGLPTDPQSRDNAVLVLYEDDGYLESIPLLLDPQCQAVEWIKRLMEGQQLQSTTLDDLHCTKMVESSLQFGSPILLQNVGGTDHDEERMFEIEAMVSDRLKPKNGLESTKIGKSVNSTKCEEDKVEDIKFRCLMTSRVSDPATFSGEIWWRFQVINFSVKEEGLREQLLSILVELEEPKLELEKNKLVLAVAENKRKLLDLEVWFVFDGGECAHFRKMPKMLVNLRKADMVCL